MTTARTLPFLILLLAALSVAGAQGTGAITGRVVDRRGKVAAGACVMIVDTGSKPRYVATTGRDGSFVIAGLSAGSHQLQIDGTGSLVAFLSITVGIGQPAHLNIVLKPVESYFPFGAIRTAQMVKPERVSSTGTAKVITGEELERRGW
ncbi:MAG: Carboxypeptidase regulatory-like domain [Chlorobi bacterium]|nr:Carboxypeptidase regulatory-like domain [Chlorobiota bacterium]